MKHSYNYFILKPFLLFVSFIMLGNIVLAQDSTAAVKTDTTTQPAPPPPPPASTDTKSGKTNHFIIYAGGNSNTMSGSTEKYDANSGIGWHAGIAWEKGDFVYYGIGVRYNNAVYGFNSIATSRDTGDLKVQALDVPVTLGINFLSFAKIVSLRGYISAMPSFTVGVSDNHFGIEKDNVNDFIFYGQIGIGASISIGMMDLGYNFGAQNLMKNSVSNTNPGQWFLSIGARF